MSAPYQPTQEELAPQVTDDVDTLLLKIAAILYGVVNGDFTLEVTS